MPSFGILFFFASRTARAPKSHAERPHGRQQAEAASVLKAQALLGTTYPHLPLP